MNILKREWLQLLILLLPLALALVIWDKLPQRLPIHWNLEGRADGFSSRTFAVMSLTLINIGVAALLIFLPRIDPRFRNYDQETQASVLRAIKVIRLTVTSFFSAITLSTLAMVLGVTVRVPVVVNIGLALLFIITGSVMTKLPPNWFFGFRTPWTLESRDVWAKTHRLGGKLMMAGGAFLLAFQFAVPIKSFYLFVLLPVIAVIALVPAVASYFFLRKQKLLPPTNSSQQ